MNHLRLALAAMAAAIVVGVSALIGSGTSHAGGPITCNGIPATVIGTNSNEFLVGTAGPDVIAGLGGSDFIMGFGGNDLVCAGDGNDLVDGGFGNDLIYGQQGNDALVGSDGKDGMVGGAGFDACMGHGGIDIASTCEISDIPVPVTASAAVSSDNSLIVEVDGTVATAGDVYVEYRRLGGGPTFRSAAESTDGTDYTAHVVRLRPDTIYLYQVFGTNGLGEIGIGPTGAFVTGSLPAGLADASFNVVSGQPTSDLTLMDFDDPDFRGIAAIDGEGEIVWYLDTTDEHGTAALAQKPNGNIVYIAEEIGTAGYALVEVNPLGEVVDMVEEDVCPTTDRGPWHHEVHILSDTEVMFLSRDIQDPFGDPTKPQEGDTINIWDQTAETVTEVWNVFDFFDPLTERTPDSDLVGGVQWSGCDGTTPTQDWTHGNSAKRSLDGSGDVLYSARHLDQITSIAPDYQSLNWRLGGPGSDFTFPDPSDKFYHQHAAWQLPNGNILLFDNGNGRPAEEGGLYTRALELELDFDTMEATKVWEYRHTPDLFAGCCSNAIRLDNGNTLIVFGSDFATAECCRTFTIVEADADGNTVWVAEESSPFKPIQYRVYPADSIMGETILP